MQRRHGQGSIEKLPSGSWRARLWIDGRRVQRTKPTKDLAQDWLTRQLRIKESLEYEAPRGSWPRVRLRELRDEYLEECERLGRTPNTIRGYISSLNVALELYGHLRAADITPPILREIAANFSGRGWAPATQRNRLNAITALLRFAMEAGYIPARELPVRRPRVIRSSSPPIYTTKQLAKLVAAAKRISDRHLAAILLPLDAGLRLGEVLRFRPEDLDAKRRTVTVPVRSETDLPKSGRSRVLPVPDRLVQVVGRLEALPGGRLIGDEDWGTTTPLHGWLRPIWQMARLKTGVKVHWLRHCWASNLANAPDPASPYELMSWGGWTSLKMVERYYHAPSMPRRGPVESLGRSGY